MEKKKRSESSGGIESLIQLPKKKELNRTKIELNLQTMKRVIEANFELETKLEKIKGLLDDCYSS